MLTRERVLKLRCKIWGIVLPFSVRWAVEGRGRWRPSKSRATKSRRPRPDHFCGFRPNGGGAFVSRAATLFSELTRGRLEKKGRRVKIFGREKGAKMGVLFRGPAQPDAPAR